MDSADEKLSDIAEIYWIVTIGVLVWIPTLVMIVCYGLIFGKIKRSIKKVPYMSGNDVKSYS